ncbi:MAG: hypothetical protein MJK14_05865 [Rivularia sp. ALOHA_DT_140]|nr:hypothetical protein [Rivularia sp. ALOHA_DT_140]
MTTYQEIKEQARANARNLLSQSQSFREMERGEQMQVYKQIVNREYDKLAKQNGLTMQLGERGASRQIDDARHQNQRIGEVGEIGADFIDSVDFPQFVEDLLQAVFDANLNVTIQQMDTYGELMKAATASLSKFVNEIDDASAFGYLAENQSNKYSLKFPDEGGKQAILTDKDGDPIDMGDNEIKAKIMDAKLAMAREQRALLRETILMGISRLVVEKGTVKAAVVFDVKATENIQRKDMAQDIRETVSGKNRRGSFLGLFGSGRTTTKKKTQISVSSAKSTSTTDLAANITGSVEINFKSDYFKLDNFANMYGEGDVNNQQQLPPTGNSEQ